MTLPDSETAADMGDAELELFECAQGETLMIGSIVVRVLDVTGDSVTLHVEGTGFDDVDQDVLLRQIEACAVSASGSRVGI